MIRNSTSTYYYKNLDTRFGEIIINFETQFWRFKSSVFFYTVVSVRIHAERVRYENRTFGRNRGPCLERGSVRANGQKRKKLINKNLRTNEPRTCVCLCGLLCESDYIIKLWRQAPPVRDKSRSARSADICYTWNYGVFTIYAPARPDTSGPKRFRRSRFGRTIKRNTEEGEGLEINLTL